MGLAQYFHTDNAGCLAGQWAETYYDGDQVDLFGCGSSVYHMDVLVGALQMAAAFFDSCVEVYGQDSRALQDRGFVKGRPELSPEPLWKSRYFLEQRTGNSFECVS